MTLEEFEILVQQALKTLPVTFAEKLDNVEVLVEAWPTREDLISVKAGPTTTLFGLYRGVPQTKRGNYSGVTPDIIVIFAGPLLMYFGENEDRLKTQIQKTLFHEIGHHFGMSEAEIRNAQLKLR